MFLFLLQHIRFISSYYHICDKKIPFIPGYKKRERYIYVVLRMTIHIRTTYASDMGWDGILEELLQNMVQQEQCQHLEQFFKNLRSQKDIDIACYEITADGMFTGSFLLGMINCGYTAKDMLIKSNGHHDGIWTCKLLCGNAGGGQRCLREFEQIARTAGAYMVQLASSLESIAFYLTKMHYQIGVHDDRAWSFCFTDQHRITSDEAMMIQEMTCGSMQHAGTRMLTIHDYVVTLNNMCLSAAVPAGLISLRSVRQARPVQRSANSAWYRSQDSGYIMYKMIE